MKYSLIKMVAGVIVTVLTAVLICYLITVIGRGGSYEKLSKRNYIMTVVPVDENNNLIDTGKIDVKIFRTGNELDLINIRINRAIIDSAYNHNRAIIIKPIIEK